MNVICAKTIRFLRVLSILAGESSDGYLVTDRASLAYITGDWEVSLKHLTKLCQCGAITIPAQHVPGQIHLLVNTRFRDLEEILEAEVAE